MFLLYLFASFCVHLWIHKCKLNILTNVNTLNRWYGLFIWMLVGWSLFVIFPKRHLSIIAMSLALFVESLTRRCCPSVQKSNRLKCGWPYCRYCFKCLTTTLIKVSLKFAGNKCRNRTHVVHNETWTRYVIMVNCTGQLVLLRGSDPN